MFTCSFAVLLIYIGSRTHSAASACDVMTESGNCFLFQWNTTLDWAAAGSHCRGVGGHLAVVGGIDDQHALAQVMSQVGVADVWLGARQAVTDWTWVSDGSVLSEQGCYRDYGGDRDLRHKMTVPEKLVPQLCVDACRKNGFKYAGTQSGTDCYCGDTYGRYGLSRGNLTCSVSCRGDDNLYCGGWARNSIYFVNGSFGTWSYLQPDNAFGYERCTVMQTKANDFRLADEECWSEQRFICLLDITSCASGNGNTTDAGKCVFIGETPQTWLAARTHCLQLGGDLLSLSSKTLSEDITRLMRRTNDTMTKRHWVGATSVHWTWVTGEPMHYANWTSGAPSGRPYTCMTMSSHLQFGWLDEQCNVTKPFVCEIVAETQTSTAVRSTTTASEVTSRVAVVESLSVDSSTESRSDYAATSAAAPTSDGSGENGQTEGTVVEGGGLSRFNIILIVVGVAGVVCVVSVALVCVSCKKRERTAVQAAS